MYDLEIQSLKSFVAVAETGGFTTAAPRVHRSQSAVSMHIKKLEEALGTSLLERTTRGVSLTTQGEALLAHARRMLEIHDQALLQLKEMIVEGNVRIGVMDDYATHILPPVFARFERAYPNIILEVTTGMTKDLLRRLGEDFDLVLATQPLGTGKGKVLRQEKTCWAFSATRTLPENAIVPLAVLERGNLFRKWAMESLDNAGIPWRVVFTSSSISAMEAAAEAGIAVTVVKKGTARKGLRLLDRRHGFPDLPTSEIALYKAADVTTSAAHQLSLHLERELGEPL